MGRGVSVSASTGRMEKEGEKGGPSAVFDSVGRPAAGVGEGGPIVIGGVRERVGKRGRAALFKQDLKQIPNSNVSNKSQTASNFGRLEKYFPSLGKWK
jgi:hypothetical protein